MRHIRNFSGRLICSDCDGTGRIECGRLGPNDPDVFEIRCEECDGTGEVIVDASNHGETASSDEASDEALPSLYQSNEVRP